MSDRIASSTKVYIWITQRGKEQRIWLNSYETVRNPRGVWVLKPRWDDEPQAAGFWSFEAATIIRRRLSEEGFLNPNVHMIRLSLNPTAEEVSAPSPSSTRLGDDTRVPMAFRGLIAVPGTHVQRGRCWYVRFPNSAIESICGDTVEDAVNRVFDMQLQDRAEKASPPPATEPERKVNQGPRQRPGDRY
jgi:hypothetical protein